MSIAAWIGVHIMVRQQRAQSVRAFTPTPAAVQFGTQVFALVGTDPTQRLKEWFDAEAAASRAVGFKRRSGVCALRPAAALMRAHQRRFLPAAALRLAEFFASRFASELLNTEPYEADVRRARLPNLCDINRSVALTRWRRAKERQAS